MLPCVAKSTDFTAVLGGHYNCTATLTVTDPTPENGAGFTVFVRNGTVTVGGTNYTVPGTEVCRVYHSGAWSNFVKYPVSGGEGTVGQILGSNGAGSSPSFQGAYVSANATANAYTVPVDNRSTTITNNSAATLTVTMTTAGAYNGQLSLVGVVDFSAVAQTITWVNTENSDVSVPGTSRGSTTIPKMTGFRYNSGTSKWTCVAVS
jgi:hypothetical protein